MNGNEDKVRNTEGTRRNGRKLLPFIVGGAVVLLAALGIGGAYLVGGGRANAERHNTLALARDYVDRGEYQRALDLLDKLLIEDAGDAEARSLRDAAIAASKKADEERANGDKSIAGALDQVGKAVENATKAATEGSAKAAAAAAAAAADASRRDAERKAAEEAAARAADEAAAKRAAEEAAAARKRAEEEELAKKSKELQDKMRVVNDLISQGRKSVEDKKWGDASSTFSEAVSRMPDGETRFEGQKLAEIADTYYQGYRADPTGQEGQDSLKEAIRYARDSVKTDSGQAMPHYTLGKINGDLKQWDNATTELKEAVRLDPKNYLYSFELGRAYFNARKFADARQAFETATALAPNFEPAWYNLGGTLRVLGKRDDALVAYRKAVAAKSDYGAAYREIGRILASKGDATGAVEAFKKALSISPDDIASLRELGVALSSQGNNQEAEAAFKRALAIDSGDDQTNYNMAIVEIALGKGADALRYATAATKAGDLKGLDEKTRAVYQFTLGLAAEGAGDQDLAIASYTKAAALDKNYVKPRLNLSDIYLKNDFPDRALDYLIEAYNVAPKDFTVNNNLGAAYARKELWDKSVDHYQKALAVDPKSATVRLNLARAYVGSGKLDEAKGVYVDLLKLEPNNADAIFELGKVYASLGDRDQARKWLGDLVARYPQYEKRGEAERILAGL